MSAEQPIWHAKCENGACVEIGVDGDAVMVRSSSAPDVAITLTRDEWYGFLADAKEGLFDQL